MVLFAYDNRPGFYNTLFLLLWFSISYVAIAQFTRNVGQTRFFYVIKESWFPFKVSYCNNFQMGQP